MHQPRIVFLFSILCVDTVGRVNPFSAMARSNVKQEITTRILLRVETATILAVISMLVLAGCSSQRNRGVDNPVFANTAQIIDRKIETPDVQRTPYSHPTTASPLTSDTEVPSESHLMTLDETIHLALSNTDILRSLGATVLRVPQQAPGVFDPAIQATDPNFGIEAALSAFDANLAGSFTYQNNDDVFNNSTLGGGATEVQQDLTVGSLALSKIAATGTQFALRSQIQHDNSNAPGNLFPHAWNMFWEAEARQPLLQGRGIEFNRIAGPNSRVGFLGTSGVLISRINNDISIAQFEQEVRNYVDEVTEAYWNLYFAFRNFEATKMGRDASLSTWNTIKAKFDNDLPGGEADKEAQAREQYYQFQEQLVTALNGDRTQATPGVLQAEADLRRLVGMPQSDGRIIRPVDKPIQAKTVYDWNVLLAMSLNARVELRQQMWRVKQRQLELLAARNFLLPRLDAVATFRNNGFGDDLTGGNARFSNALDDLTSGDHNDWELGLQLNVPVGYRQASSGVRNAELSLRRERALLQEQEKQIIHDLGSAVRQSDLYHSTTENAYRRLQAAKDVVASRKAAFNAESVSLDLLLEGQQRLYEAQISYERALTRYQLAGISLARESGQLLSGFNISLTESPSLNCAGIDVASRQCKVRKAMDYRF